MLKRFTMGVLGLAVSLLVSSSTSAPAQAYSASPGFGVGVAAAKAANGMVTPTGEHVKIGKTPAAKNGHKGQRTKDGNQPIRLFASTYRYAGAQQTFNANGAIANIEVPTVGTLDASDHSLVELSIQRDAAGVLADAVEIGFQKGELGCATACLFVYSWEAGVGQGYNGGNGYTDIVDTCGTGGTNVTAGQTATPGATVKLGWLYGGSPLGWYAYWNSCGFGYYPASAWASTTFTSATTTFNQAFGEVYDSDGSATPCSNMGNGTLATTTTGALIGSYLLGTAPAASVNMVAFTQNVISTSYYEAKNASTRTYRYGGPGQC